MKVDFWAYFSLVALFMGTVFLITTLQQTSRKSRVVYIYLSTVVLLIGSNVFRYVYTYNLTLRLENYIYNTAGVNGDEQVFRSSESSLPNIRDYFSERAARDKENLDGSYVVFYFKCEDPYKDLVLMNKAATIRLKKHSGIGRFDFSKENLPKTVNKKFEVL